MQTPPPNSSRSPDRLSLFWRCFEIGYQRLHRIEPVTPEPDCLLAFNRVTHRGPAVSLRCGTTIRAGDVVLEMHFRREALLPLIRTGDPIRMGLGLARLGERDVRKLADRLASDPQLRDVRAIHALTLFHRGIRRFGFEVRPISEKRLERWFSWWHRVLMARDHAQGTERVRRHMNELVSRHVWISREALLDRYAAPRQE